MAERIIIVCRDARELNQKAAEQFIAAANRATKSTGRFTVALSGGSTPMGLYALLASADYNRRIPWNQVHLFWGDERCVPPDHPQSNFRMVRESLLTKIKIPPENVHRMAGEKEPKTAAVEYEEQMMKFFRLSEGTLPRFDLILLGLGEDGHTASLFPGSDALNETKQLVAANFVEKFNAHRLTLTLPVLNHGADVVFLVAGQSKAAVVKEILGKKTDSPVLPAARVMPLDGHLTWLITRDAATALVEP